MQNRGRVKTPASAQRGAAAVEFAIALPLFMIVAGLTVTISQAVSAKQTMIDIANSAVRQCALQPPVRDAEVIRACAADYAQNLINVRPILVCANTPLAQAITHNTSDPKVFYVQVTIDCDVPLSSFATAGNPEFAIGPAFPIHATAAQSFMLRQF